MMSSTGSGGFAPFFSTTGYLEDALIEFSIRFKRRRLIPLSLPCSSTTSGSTAAVVTNGSAYDDDHAIRLVDHRLHFLNESAAAFVDNDCRRATIPDHQEPTAAALSLQDTAIVDSSRSSSSMLNSIGSNHTLFPPKNSSLQESDQVRKRGRTATRVVVYPFGLVKPGGVNGDVTLKDINQRILMPPTRPVRHPVGEYVCQPCVSRHGPGLSGKSVVALTRIHTQGRGTITIIRTRG